MALADKLRRARLERKRVKDEHSIADAKRALLHLEKLNERYNSCKGIEVRPDRPDKE